jgi:sugar phosphate isomerase/epimerase
MQLTVSSYTFGALPIDGALAVCHSLGFTGVDIAGFRNGLRASYDPDAVGANPDKNAEELKRLLDQYELKAINFFAQFGTSFEDRSTNHPDRTVHEKNAASVRGIARFCKLVGIPGITVLPGVDHPGCTQEENLDIAGEALGLWTQIAGDEGISLCFEPHVGSVSCTPELALSLIERSPQTKIALDYSHFVLQYIPVERIHPIIPYAGHFHIRPARSGRLQTRWVDGSIDFVDIIQRLKNAGYADYLSIEYVSADWYDMNQLDTISETLTTKLALETYVGA